MQKNRPPVPNTARHIGSGSEELERVRPRRDPGATPCRSLTPRIADWMPRSIRVCQMLIFTPVVSRYTFVWLWFRQATEDVIAGCARRGSGRPRTSGGSNGWCRSCGTSSSSARPSTTEPTHSAAPSPGARAGRACGSRAPPVAADGPPCLIPSQDRSCCVRPRRVAHAARSVGTKARSGWGWPTAALWVAESVRAVAVIEVVLLTG